MNARKNRPRQPTTLAEAIKRIRELETLPRKIIRVSNEDAGVDQWIVADAAKLVPDEPRTSYSQDYSAR